MEQLEKFNFEVLTQEVQDYLTDLQDFIDQHQLSTIAQPDSLDHLAVKAYNSSDFEQFLDSVKPQITELSFIRLNNRRLATALLLNSVSLGKFGSANVLEIMEPRPEKVGKGLVGFEHVELYFPDLDQVMKLLKDRGVEHQFYENASHQAVVVKINDAGQEVKFTNKHLAEIVKEQIKNGTSKLFNNPYSR